MTGNMIDYDMIGFASIALVSLLSILAAFRLRDITSIIIVALSIRVILILIGHYVHPLPDSTADAVTFEGISNRMAADGFFNLLSYYEGPSSQFLSWLIAVPYSLFGRSVLMAQSISLFFGISCILLAWNLSHKLWDKQTAKKVAWITALFPSLVLYSVLVMREVYFCFFLLVALHGVCDWIKKETLKSFILAMSGFVGGIFFHGAIAVGAIVFLIFVSVVTFKKILTSLINLKMNLTKLAIFLIFLGIAQLYITNKITLSYLGNFKGLSNMDKYLSSTEVATRGTASWPEWTTIQSYTEVIYKAPLRSLYFVFAPFPWDIKETKHLIGMFDSFFYMYFVYLIISNLKNIWKDRRLRIVLLMLLAYLFVFGFGVGNFGTGIRHRSKFVIIFIILAAPLIKRFIFFKKLDKK